MKYVLLYESTPDFRAKVPAHIEAHRALWKTFHTDRRLLMVTMGLMAAWFVIQYVGLLLT